MSELSEIYESMRNISREKKHYNKEFSTALLDKLGIDYKSSNGGIHLIVFGEHETIDFYPSTGKWIPRQHKQFSKRGVYNMLKYMEAQDESARTSD